jgi:hypothetical protein
MLQNSSFVAYGSAGGLNNVYGGFGNASHQASAQTIQGPPNWRIRFSSVVSDSGYTLGVYGGVGGSTQAAPQSSITAH